MIATVECSVCAYQWVAAFADEDALTCPNCHDQDSNIIEYHSTNMRGKIIMGEIVEYVPDNDA